MHGKSGETTAIQTRTFLRELLDRDLDKIDDPFIIGSLYSNMVTYGEEINQFTNDEWKNIEKKETFLDRALLSLKSASSRFASWFRNESNEDVGFFDKLKRFTGKFLVASGALLTGMLTIGSAGLILSAPPIGLIGGTLFGTSTKFLYDAYNNINKDGKTDTEYYFALAKKLTENKQLNIDGIESQQNDIELKKKALKLMQYIAMINIDKSKRETEGQDNKYNTGTSQNVLQQIKEKIDKKQPIVSNNNAEVNNVKTQSNIIDNKDINSSKKNNIYNQDVKKMQNANNKVINIDNCYSDGVNK